MTVLTPNSMKELEDIIQNAGDKLVIIDFFATWCGPCKIMGPKFHKFADEFGAESIFVKIDVDENEDVAAVYNVNVMPTFIFVKHGKQFKSVEGKNEDEIRNTIEENK